MKNLISSIKLRRFGWHVLFWIAVLLYHTLYRGRYDEAYLLRAVGYLASIPFDMIATYFSLYYLFAKVFAKAKIFQILFLFHFNNNPNIIL